MKGNDKRNSKGKETITNEVVQLSSVFKSQYQTVSEVPTVADFVNGSIQTIGYGIVRSKQNNVLAGVHYWSAKPGEEGRTEIKEELMKTLPDNVIGIGAKLVMVYFGGEGREQIELVKQVMGKEDEEAAKAEEKEETGA